MIPIIVGLLVTASAYLLLYQFKFVKPGSEKAHLSSRVLKEGFEEELDLRKDTLFSALSKSRSPLTDKFKTYERKITANHLRRRLIKAGSPMGILEFLAFKLLSLIFVPLAGFIFLGSAFPRKDMLLVIFLVVGYFLPDMWLNKKIKRRQHNIRKDLPNIIDLLNLCVSGGLDFMLAVNRAIKDLKPCDLTMELDEVYRETQMGKSRREALKNFAWRIDIPEVHSFVRTLVQADRMGTPIEEALKLQSEEIRVNRFQRGEAMALKAPIKLLFPLFAFILPVVLILVAGPIILQFAKSNIGF